jgi:hypothetical protein
MDFNNAVSSSFDLIPAGSICPLIMTIRPGAVGDGGWESSSEKSAYSWLNCEYVVTGGPFKGRKFWGNMMSGHPEAENKAVSITRSSLRGILESSRGIKADDTSEDAMKARIVDSFGDFSGMEFVGKIGIEKGRDGYDDKNKMANAIAFGSRDYNEAGSAKPANEAAPSAPQGEKPNWA